MVIQPIVLPLIATATIGTVVETRRIEDLPLNGNLQLASFVPDNGANCGAAGNEDILRVMGRLGHHGRYRGLKSGARFRIGTCARS
jgi:hypothetical protein